MVESEWWRVREMEGEGVEDEGMKGEVRDEG